MAGYLWLRSPAAKDTLQHAVVRYGRFVALLDGDKTEKDRLVPTADIELVRRTEVLAGRGHVRIGVDGGGKEGFGETRVLYEGRWKEEYAVCLCWECEEVRRVVGEEEGKEERDWDGIAARVRHRVELYKAVELARRSEMKGLQR